jgi:putrescine transport system substrate-binding protein
MKIFGKTFSALSLVGAVISIGAVRDVPCMFTTGRDYIVPDTVENFTKETGIKVVYDVFDSNET